jgi:hypothetical protein
VWGLLLFVVVAAVVAPLVGGDVLLVGGSDWLVEVLEPPDLLHCPSSLLSPPVIVDWGDCVLPALGVTCSQGTS